MMSVMGFLVLKVFGRKEECMIEMSELEYFEVIIVLIKFLEF